MKVLIIAYAVDPYQGSEPGVGWNFVKRICNFTELAVVTESKFQKNIEKYINSDECSESIKNIKWSYIPRYRNKFLRKLWPPIYYSWYNKWHLAVFNKYKSSIREYDVVHNLTLCGFREMGFLYKLKDVNWVWGPVGGSTNTPMSLLLNVHFSSWFYYVSRNIWNYFQFRFNSRIHEISKTEVKLISATEDVYKDFKNVHGLNSIIIPEVGSLNVDISTISKNHNQLIWVGTLNGGKGLNILLLALSKLDVSLKWNLLVIGEGRLNNYYTKLTKKLNIQSRINFLGKLSHDETKVKLYQSQIAIITSIKDLTSTVLMEYIEAELSVIAPEYSGFKIIRETKSGSLIPIKNRKLIVNKFREEIQKRLISDKLKQTEALNSIKWKDKLSWDSKIKQILNYYNK